MKKRRQFIRSSEFRFPMVSASIDYYHELGIERYATPAEIRDAYKRAALRWHPDRNKAKEAEEKFKTIKRAYDVLIDDKRRRQYDAERFPTPPSSTWFETKTYERKFESFPCSKEGLSKLNFRFVQHSFVRRSDGGADRSAGHSLRPSILPGIEFHLENVEFAGISSIVHATVPIDEPSGTSRPFVSQRTSSIETRVRARLSFVHDERLVVRGAGRLR